MPRKVFEEERKKKKTRKVTGGGKEYKGLLRGKRVEHTADRLRVRLPIP